jgi:Ni2+-binding GTPase involved in maturation of urease and hydrogenase
MKLTNKVVSASHRVLVYGPPKSGKTQLVSQLAAKYKLIWFDLENGYQTLLKLPTAQQGNIELVSIPDTKTFPIAIETMLKVMIGNKVIICEEHGKVSCPMCTKDSKPAVTVCLNELTNDTVVVIDSLTQLSNSAIAFITKNQPDDYKMDYSDWGNLKAVVEKFLSQVQQAKYNIVCISHEEEVEMEDGRKKIVPVCGSSKSSRNTAKYFDHVIYCEVKNKKHGAASSTTFMNNVVTGSRTDVVMETAAIPSLLDIFVSKSLTNATPGQTAMNSLKQMGAGK